MGALEARSSLCVRDFIYLCILGQVSQHAKSIQFQSYLGEFALCGLMQGITIFSITRDACLSFKHEKC